MKKAIILVVGLLALSAILKASGYVCIVSQELEQAERSVATYNIDLIVVFAANRTKVAGELQKIRKVPVLALIDDPEREYIHETTDLVVYDRERPEVVLQAVTQLLDAHK